MDHWPNNSRRRGCPLEATLQADPYSAVTDRKENYIVNRIHKIEILAEKLKQLNRYTLSILDSRIAGFIQSTTSGNVSVCQIPALLHNSLRTLTPSLTSSQQIWSTSL